MKRNEDRRSPLDDRRKYLSIEYWDDPKAIERRSYVERRIKDERREGWARISLWSSIEL